MRAVVVDVFGGPEVARVREVPEPKPGAGQVLIEVAAAAVNPVDLVTRRGLLHAAALHGVPPVRLGWDVAGTVTEIGSGVRRLRPGSTVVGVSDRLAALSKTHAEKVVLDQSAVAAIDDRADLATMSTLPLAGLTAWQALESAGLRRGCVLLVTGAVGSMVVQLALLRGAAVLGAGRPSHRVVIESSGARFVDTAGLAENAREVVPEGVDAAIDTAVIGGQSLDAVRNRGRHVSLVVSEQPTPLRGINSTSIAIRADWEQLTILGNLATTRAIQLPEVTTAKLDDASAAYADAEAKRSGRITLTP
jgi:NADPH:quinone reductase-like Zn-dependent oxidoreductase